MLLIIALLSVLVWLGLLFARQGFWRADQRLEAASSGPPREAWPSVTAIIPARDEATVIGKSVASVLGQSYPGRLRVLVVDDSSQDGTGQVARNLLAEQSNAQRGGEVLSAPPLPAGWAGKLWAIHCAEQRLLGEAAEPDYVWLTDADIVHAPDTLSRLVEKARIGQFSMVSVMVRLRLESFWERRLVPAFIFFFQKLYPFPAVNAPGSSMAAAAGGCILLETSAMKSIGGIAALKDALIDDCTLAALVKRSGRPIWLGLTNDSISLRQYDDLGTFWAMVARSAYEQLNNSPLMLIVTLVSMSLTYLAPPLIVLSWPLHGGTAAALLAACAWTLMAIAYRPTLRYYGFGPQEALWLPFSALLYTVMTLDSARQSWLGRGSAWKGRHYPANGERALGAHDSSAHDATADDATAQYE